MTATIIIIAMASLLTGAGFFAADRYRVRRAAVAAAFNDAVQRVRSGQARPVFVRMREQLRDRVMPWLLAREQHQAAAALSETRKADLMARTWPKGRPSPGLLILMGILSVVWLVLFALIRATDIYVLKALGQTQPVAEVLGTIVALVFTVLGWFVTGLLGFHELMPPSLHLPMYVKAASVVLILGAGVALTMGVQEIAPYRSISTVGVHLDTAKKVLAQVQSSTPVDPVQVAAAEADVVALTTKLDTAKRFDTLVVTVMPPVEMLVSGAPIVMAEALLIGLAGLPRWYHERRAGNAGRRIDRETQRVRVQAMTILEAAGRDPDLYDGVIGQLEGGQQPPNGVPPHTPADNPSGGPHLVIPGVIEEPSAGDPPSTPAPPHRPEEGAASDPRDPGPARPTSVIDEDAPNPYANF